MNTTEALIQDIAIYVTGLYNRFYNPELLYHNLAHTERVAMRVKEIAAGCSLDAEDLFISSAAAWFHDVGHLFGISQGHEERSILIMQEYCRRLPVNRTALESIGQAILATHFPYEPKTLTSEVLCDADSYHLGTEEFLLSDDLVKQEFELRNKFLPGSWNKATLYVLEKHHFFTPYCKTLLEMGKQKNIDIVRARIINES
jgi:predicted metal-dependent HD superfamily phosphohydrolase